MNFVKIGAKIVFGIVFIVLLSIGIFIFHTILQIQNESYDFKTFKVPLTSHIYDRNGKLIAKVFEENRIYAKYEEIPPRLIEALVAIEDTSFFEHDGINIDAIFRAIVKDIKTRSLKEGASTLTQQLIKNTMLTREKSLKRKFKEAVLSYEIEYRLSKEEILERYLNYMFFGHGYYGIKTASQGYFHKDLDELNLKEIAILVGLPKAPSTYDPTRRLDLSLSRANRVLNRMYNLGWISKDEYEKYVDFIPEIFDDTLTQNVAPYVVDEVLRQALAMGIEDIKTGGYNIYLNIDLNIQDMAQNSIKLAYDEIVKRDKDIDLEQINGAMVVVEPDSGAVVALVGGVDYEKSNFNRATMSNRQPGSSFKPFLYQIALNLGYSPMSKVADISRVFDLDEKDATGKNKKWKPKNVGGNFQGMVTLKDALTRSRNLATLNLMLDIGLDVVYPKILEFGFDEGIPQDLSISLGSFGISPYRYSELYTILSNYGAKRSLVLIKSIEKDGVVREFESVKTKYFEPEQAYLLIDMMKNVVENGTGRNARVAGYQVAGKTGTSNKSIDAWFVGFTPNIQAIAWFGNDNNTPMKYTEGGARTAAPAVGYFLREYVKKYPTKKVFWKPPLVKQGIYNDKLEYFTDKSPLPRQDSIDSITNTQDEELMW